MNLTKHFQFGAGVIALCTLLTYINLLPSTISNLLIVITFIIIYLLFSATRGGFSLLMLLPITGAFAIIFLNRDPTMISLVLLWLIYDMQRSSQIDIKRVARTFFITGCIGYILTLVAYFAIGLNKHADLVMWRVDHLVSRSSLGFQQPNASMLYVVSLTLAFVLAYKVTLKQYISALVVIISLYTLNQSRTGLILSILLLTVVKFNIKIPVPRLIMIMIAALSYALMVMPINLKLDEILSGRLTLYHAYSNQFGIHPIGNPIVANSMIDNGYIQMLLSKGWIFGLFFFISLLIIAKPHNRLGTIAFLIYALSAFTETTFLHLDLLFPVLLILIPTQTNNATLERSTLETN